MSISRRLENLPVMRFHYSLLFWVGVGWLFDSMDTGIISFVLPVLMRTWPLTPAQISTIGSVGLAWADNCLWQLPWSVNFHQLPNGGGFWSC